MFLVCWVASFHSLLTELPSRDVEDEGAGSCSSYLGYMSRKDPLLLQVWPKWTERQVTCILITLTIFVFCSDLVHMWLFLFTTAQRFWRVPQNFTLNQLFWLVQCEVLSSFLSPQDTWTDGLIKEQSGTWFLGWHRTGPLKHSPFHQEKKKKKETTFWLLGWGSN